MRISFLFLLLMTPAYLHLAAQEKESCGALINRDSNFVVSFLEEQSATRRSPCIASVISRLRGVHDTRAVHLLVGYLDYMDPATAPQSGGGADVRPDYPAVTALFQIGKPATRELLSAIEAGKTAKIRENAAIAYMLIYRDDLASGIRLLKKEELTSGTPAHRRRVSDALQMLIDDCNGRSGKEAEACKNAAGKG